MTNNLYNAYMQSGFSLLASEGDWDLLSSFDNGMIQNHECFLVFQGDGVLNGFQEKIDQLNKSKVLGAGYHFDFDMAQPEGIRISIKPGWAVDERQASLLLKKFIQSIS